MTIVISGVVINIKRPTFLTILLVLLILLALHGLYNDLSGSGTLAKGSIKLPFWYPIFSMAIEVIDVLAIIMLWMWKKAGFYITVMTGVISVLVSTSIGGVAAGIAGGIVIIMGTLVLYLAMKPVWQGFK